MPLYEYECESCGHRFEKIRKFSDPPLEECEKCGAKVRKLMSSPAIQFKGTGWYITDYAKKSSSDAGKSSGGSKSDGAGGSDSADKSSQSEKSEKSDKAEKSDSKPAAADTTTKT